MSDSINLIVVLILSLNLFPVIGCWLTAVIVPVVLGQYGYYSNDRPTCRIPSQLQGEWYSREKGLDIITRISEEDMMQGQEPSTNYNGESRNCVNMIQNGNDNYTFHLRSTKSQCHQQFTMIYKTCDGISNVEDKEIQYKCLGDWYVDKNHFFAVVNSRESRRSEAYRCFLTNRDDANHIAVSITSECNTLSSPQQGPSRLALHPVKAETVLPSCQLPDKMRGEWINTANLDALVKINSTHMEERWRPDTGTEKEEIYVCMEKRGTRFVMARLGINGCQKDFICFDFVEPHHNIIRYRKGQAMSSDRFATVCAWTNFDSDEEWKYDILLAAKPVAIKCPVAGKFRFEQKGEIPFTTRIRGGVTQSPRSNVYCKEKVSDLSVCDADQKIMEIDAEYCISVDHRGTSIDYQSDPDHRMKCIGFWKEDLKSYLITYDEMDAYSRYRCWVYQRSDLNRVLMSMSVGAFCHFKQKVTSWNSSEGAQVALDMTEYEREHDECPMYFDDGANPYLTARESAIILDARTSGSHLNLPIKSVILFLSFIFPNLLLFF